METKKIIDLNKYAESQKEINKIDLHVCNILDVLTLINGKLMEDIEEVQNESLKLKLLEHTFQIDSLAQIIKERINPNTITEIENFVYDSNELLKEVYPNIS